MMLHAYLDFRERFREAINTDLFPIEHLDGLISSGRATILFNAHAAIVIEIKQFPSGVKAVHGLVAAGDLDQIKALIALAEAWGRERGCTIGLIESRPGWAKALRSQGYETFQVAIVKEL